jgi:hypothetical protein
MLVTAFPERSQLSPSHSSNTTGVPSLTRSATLLASQFVIRTHP